ncbi:hypothetical protein [uncultured Tateyamaria sp.]|uniref:ATP-grasp domain-containing protein n=1 Tax=uncultured Tateyamaria sp. TaxID=455651 RepID=UPI00261AA3C2|nr:hypothetical protein [uncultured Tateyamaria sp.]
MMSPSVTCLLGKSPKPGTIFDLVHDSLIARKVAVQVLLPHVSRTLGTEQWPENTLVVHRGLNKEMLDQLAQKEVDGWRFCNSPTSSVLARDRNALMCRLRSAGLPVPKWQQLPDWADVIRIGTERSVVVKAADGTVGRGTQVVIAIRNTLPKAAPFSGPYLVEEYIENDGLDRKLYVAGSRCFGLIKPWPRNPDVPAQSFDALPELVGLAMAVGVETGLEIFGVDVLLGAQGPKIVDVNVFPGFRGIDEAHSAVVHHLLERLELG